MSLVFGTPTIVGKFDLGASSPEIPAFIVDDPLSITTEYYYSPDIYFEIIKYNLHIYHFKYLFNSN